MQLAHPEVLLPVEAPLGALDGDGEDGVASAARLVHVSRAHRPGGGYDVSFDNHHI